MHVLFISKETSLDFPEQTPLSSLRSGQVHSQGVKHPTGLDLNQLHSLGPVRMVGRLIPVQVEGRREIPEENQASAIEEGGGGHGYEERRWLLGMQSINAVTGKKKHFVTMKMEVLVLRRNLCIWTNLCISLLWFSRVVPVPYALHSCSFHLEAMPPPVEFAQRAVPPCSPPLLRLQSGMTGAFPLPSGSLH